MLAASGPLDIINGQKIDVGKSLSWSNDKEYHHFFPQAYLARKRIGSSKANVVGNIVLLTSKSLFLNLILVGRVAAGSEGTPGRSVDC
jgi:hypothetical protein